METVPPPLLPPAAPVPPPQAAAPALCANCGTVLAGPYCCRCGQHVADYHRSVWRFLADFFDNTFCWDNKFLLTIVPLVKQPGFLTREFMAGRRARYVHPLRLFLFTSAVCLALIGFVNHHSHRKSVVRINASPPGKSRPGLQIDVGGGKARPAGSPAGADEDDPGDEAKPGPTTAVPTPTPTPGSPPAQGFSLAEQIAQAVRANAVHAKKGSSAGPPGAATSPASEAAGEDPLDRRINRLVDHAGAVAERAVKAGEHATNDFDAADARKLVDSISQGIEQRLSWVGLALLPVFALFLRAVYWRADGYYFSHLVFSLHYHAFLFLFWAGWTCAAAALSRAPLAGLWSFGLACCQLLPGWYLFIALRRLYGEGPRRTAAKVLLLGSMHLLTILIGVASVGALAFFSTRK